MIYTLTLSPSLDYHFESNIEIGQINRASKAYFLAGGKGINVSLALKELGKKSVALGFLGGLAASYIKDELDEKGIANNFVEIDGETRINIKIDGEKETAFNLDGPVISSESIDQLFYSLSKLERDDLLVLSGSVGRLDKDIYSSIIKLVKLNGVKVFLDTDDLLSYVKDEPYLIKPNEEEMAKLKRGSSLSDEEFSKELCLKYGIKYVLYTLGKEGAKLITKDDVIDTKAYCFGKLVSTVGAGDQSLGAFIYALDRFKDDKKALVFATIASGIKVTKKGFASLEEIENKMKEAL